MARGPRSHWFQHSLIVVETALAVVLLTCGGLLLQTFQHLRNTDLGIESERLLTFETPLFRYKDFDRRVAFVNAEVEKVRAIPGVIDAGVDQLIPFTNVANATFYLLEGQPKDSIAGSGGAHSQRDAATTSQRSVHGCAKADSSTPPTGSPTRPWRSSTSHLRSVIFRAARRSAGGSSSANWARKATGTPSSAS